MILKTVYLAAFMCKLIGGNPRSQVAPGLAYRQDQRELTPGVYYDQERAIPSGVQRPVGRPGGYGSGSKSALRIGDWTAQWSQPDRAWYFYNHNTRVSTWLRPPALRHVIFANPKENEILDRNDNVGGVSEYQEEEQTTVGFLDNLSNWVVERIPNPWGGEKTKNTLDRGDSTVFGLELDSGGTLKEALTATLKESAMYKNVVKESLTFLIKFGGWTLLNALLYQGAIFNSTALQRFFSEGFGRSFKHGNAFTKMLQDPSSHSEEAMNSLLKSVLKNLKEKSADQERFS